MDDKTVKIGLLMETAHAQQATIEQSLDALRAHVRGLDQVVRDEVRDAVIAELRDVGSAAIAAQQALRAIARTAGRRMALWSFGVTTLCAMSCLAAAWWMLPSQAQIAALRAERDRLDAQVAGLERRGGRVDLRRCGRAQRLCVRVDRHAPSYGEQGDYLVVDGY